MSYKKQQKNLTNKTTTLILHARLHRVACMHVHGFLIAPYHLAPPLVCGLASPTYVPPPISLARLSRSLHSHAGRTRFARTLGGLTSLALLSDSLDSHHWRTYFTRTRDGLASLVPLSDRAGFARSFGGLAWLALLADPYRYQPWCVRFVRTIGGVASLALSRTRGTHTSTSPYRASTLRVTITIQIVLNYVRGHVCIFVG